MDPILQRYGVRIAIALDAVPLLPPLKHLLDDQNRLREYRLLAGAAILLAVAGKVVRGNFEQFRKK